MTELIAVRGTIHSTLVMRPSVMRSRKEGS